MTMGITSPTSTTGQILKDGTPVISFDANNNATFAGTVVSNTPLGMRNRIINGDMRIDQRNAGASVTPAASSNVYLTDRWFVYLTQASKLSFQQNAGSVTPPTGFVNYSGFTSLSAYSIASGDDFSFYQRLEGLNTSDLGWGTASGSPITLSFWVRSSLTGTFGGKLNNSAGSQFYMYSYTINAANTWEYKTITIPASTTGTWLTTNGIGIQLTFCLGAGSANTGTPGSWVGSNPGAGPTGQINVTGTNGATFYITGVQLEIGSTATSFDYRPYSAELAMCQRYYYQNTSGGGEIILGGVATATQTAWFTINNIVPMRASPTGTIVGTWTVSNAGQPTFNNRTQYAVNIQVNSSGSGQFYAYNNNSGNGYTLSAEL